VLISKSVLLGLAPSPVEQSFPFRRESRLPAAFFALELVLGLCLGCCATAVWTLHRANVSHDVNFSRLPTSSRIRTSV
jgi:hypothetical protein